MNDQEMYFHYSLGYIGCDNMLRRDIIPFIIIPIKDIDNKCYSYNHYWIDYLQTDLTEFYTLRTMIIQRSKKLALLNAHHEESYVRFLCKTILEHPERIIEYNYFKQISKKFTNKRYKRK